MPAFICTACGMQYAPSGMPPPECREPHPAVGEGRARHRGGPRPVRVRPGLQPFLRPGRTNRCEADPAGFDQALCRCYRRRLQSDLTHRAALVCPTGSNIAKSVRPATLPFRNNGSSRALRYGTPHRYETLHKLGLTRVPEGADRGTATGWGAFLDPRDFAPILPGEGETFDRERA